MASYGKVIGGSFVNATINLNRKGELALSPLGFKKTPNLTAEAVASWEEILTERRGTMGAVSKVGQAVSLAALRGPAGKAAAAAVGSTADLVRAPHTVRIDWADGAQSLIELPDKLFQHLAIMLKESQIPTVVAAPTPSTPSVVGKLTELAGAALATQSDVSKQIARLAALRDQGALTDAEFAAKKAELLGTTTVAPAPTVPPPPPAPAGESNAAPGPQAVLPPQVAPPLLATAGGSSPTAAPPPPPPPTSPPMWAPDPHRRHELRYWDGTTWTSHVSNAGVQATDPV